MLGVEERSLRTPGLVPESGEHALFNGVIVRGNCNCTMRSNGY